MTADSVKAADDSVRYASDRAHQPSRNSALSGLKVVEFGHVIAGPLAGTLMADLGADVVHVEPPSVGDAGRVMGPAKGDTYLWWKVLGRNKRSVTLDLRRSEGRYIARKLAAWADIVITNLRVPTIVEWGLDWPSLREVNPQLVMLQVTGFGTTGPGRDRPGFGKVGEARSGAVYITGFPDQPPVHTGFSHADAVTALMGAFGILAALHRKNQDPNFQGELVDLALFESLFRLIEWQVIVYDQLGIVPERAGNQLPVAPAAVINTYQTADEDWITVTSATLKSVMNVAKMIGLPANQYETAAAQKAAATFLDERLGEWVSRHSSVECLTEMERVGVVASRIFSVKDILEDVIYHERNDIVTVQDPDLGDVRMPAVVPKLQEHGGKIWRTGPTLGQDNDLVYREWIGLTEEEYAELQNGGVI